MRPLLLCGCFLALLLSACGQTGPLYLPDAAPVDVTTPEPAPAP